MRLNPQEWNSLDNIRTILRPFKKFTEYISRDLYLIQMLVRIYNEVSLLLHQIKNKEHHYAQINDSLVSTIKKGIEVFNKYWNLMGEHNLYYITTVLNPRIKTKWIRQNIPNPNEVIDRIRTFLKATYPLPEPELLNNIPADVFQVLEYTFFEPYTEPTEGVQSDIDLYLNSDCV